MDIQTVVRNGSVVSVHSSCRCVFAQLSNFLCCHAIACILAINCGSVPKNAEQFQKLKLSQGHFDISHMIHSYWKRKDCNWVIALETIKQTMLPTATPLVGGEVPAAMEQQQGFSASYPVFTSTPSMEDTSSYSYSKAQHDRV